VRTLLEPPLAALIAQRKSPNAVDYLRECVKIQQDALQKGDYVSAASGVNEFHGRLARLSENNALRLFAGMLHEIAVNMYPQIPIASSNPKKRRDIWRRGEKSAEAHGQLVELIAAGRADAARRFWEAYMSDTGDFMQKTGLSALRVVAPQASFDQHPRVLVSKRSAAAPLRGA
jgi:DNA-binding FadR family transcriptional regulator